MEAFYPVFWLILGLALAIIEAVTVQVVAIWFALGALFAIIPAMLGAPMWVQVLVFVAVSALTLLCTRRFAMRFLVVKHQHTNADRVIGETGVVVTDIDNDSGAGRVSAMGLDWSARSGANIKIPAGQKVTIISIDGVKLIVEKQEASVEVNKEEM